MITIYAYWVLSAFVALFLLEWVVYGEVEESESADKSPKHHLLFSFNNLTRLFLVVFFLLLSIFVNR